MNALPLEPRPVLTDTLDELINDHGLHRVVLTLLGRLAKRTRPPDIKVGPKAADVPGLDLLNDHLRADLGLPPAAPNRAMVELEALWGRRF
ncbi:hypothetical protein [Litoreibacter janthinus]|uniref:Uncharacterized protein n=1 Tax=Litoreibacter janthinus TaxID=670154 RepID=A0A1I6GLC3_9RHOB|nr:hypothetical protein [Litoreibacter janthinus]SFR43022.1 hypothetical protein SAMN04488002_1665 [Litoreibacter janthinus]